MNEVQRYSVPIPAELSLLEVLGVNDSHLRDLEQLYPQVSFWVAEDTIFLQGPVSDLEEALPAVERLTKKPYTKKMNKLHPMVNNSDLVEAPAPNRVPTPAVRVSSEPVAPPNRPRAVFVSREKVIRPQTAGQARYVHDINTHTITFGIGPAGTGKTYLAMARAVSALLNGEVNRLILTRPAVEAGETLGFLPGTLTDKIDPYLRPLYDALREMLDSGTIHKMMSDGTIEVAALAYMRGRTLNGSFIILDEAQNTTSEQMKMILTRLGFGSKMVITGDITQIDLPSRQPSGLKQVQGILSEVDDIAFSYLGSEDVVRHTLVGEIINAYESFEAGRERHGDSKRTSS